MRSPVSIHRTTHRHFSTGSILVALAALAAGTAGHALAKGDAPAAPAARGGDAYKDAVSEAYQTYKGFKGGKNSNQIPALSKADPNAYGLAIVTVSGGVYEAGAARAEFPIESVGNVLTLARAIETSSVMGRPITSSSGIPSSSGVLPTISSAGTPTASEMICPARRLLYRIRPSGASSAALS